MSWRAAVLASRAVQRLALRLDQRLVVKVRGRANRASRLGLSSAIYSSTCARAQIPPGKLVVRPASAAMKGSAVQKSFLPGGARSGYGSSQTISQCPAGAVGDRPRSFGDVRATATGRAGVVGGSARDPAGPRPAQRHILRLMPQRPPHVAWLKLGAEPGLCGACRHAKLNETHRGTAYLRCMRAAWDITLSRYPRLPVTQCGGFEQGDGKP